MKIILVTFFILISLNPFCHSQKLGENSTFSAKYCWIEIQNLRNQTNKCIPEETFISYNREGGYITIKSFDDLKSFKVKNFRLEYVGKEQLNCMNVVQSNFLGAEEIIGAIWWNKSKFALAPLGGDKVVIFYNINNF